MLRNRARSRGRRRASLTGAAATIALVVTGLTAPAATAAVPAEGSSPGTVVEVIRTTGPTGLQHPGVGFSADDLENARDQVRAGEQPWSTYYAGLAANALAAADWRPSNMAGEGVDQPVTQYNIKNAVNRAETDSAGALAQAIRYLVTGEDVYRANALHAIRTWSNLDPAQYGYFADAHIHSGIPGYQLVVAAEIIRYTEPQATELDGYGLVWTDEDTRKLKENFVDPNVATFWFNQHAYWNQFNYGQVGALAGAIATDDADLLAERVEWALVNSGYDPVQGGGDYNGSLTAIFREIPADLPGNTTGERFVQHMEMVRDQPHSLGDILNFSMILRMLDTQDLTVDPESGELSDAADAVDPYAFGDDRLLEAAESFYAFDLGYDIPWVDVDGGASVPSEDGRGRGFALINEIYYQYKYREGVDVAAVAPHVVQAREQEPGLGFWGFENGSYTTTDLSLSHGFDYWLALPATLDTQDTTVPATASSTDLLVGRVGVALGDGASLHRPDGPDGAGGYAVLDPRQDGQIAVNKVQWRYRPAQSTTAIRVKSDGSTTLQLAKTRDRAPYATIAVPDTGGEFVWLGVETGSATVPISRGGDAILFLTATGGTATEVVVDRVKPLDHAGMTDRVDVPAFTRTSFSSAAVAGETATFSFEASVGSGTVTYAVDGAPEGVAIDPATGVLTVSPTQTGRLDLLVVARAGSAAAALPVAIEVTATRPAAVEAVLAPLTGAELVSASRAAVDAARAGAEAAVTGTETEFAAALDALRAAVADADLLTPQLADGTLDYSRLVTSDRLDASALGSLVDDDNQTYWGNFAYEQLVIDFGVDFRVRTDRFGMLGRSLLAFRASGTTLYGSDDGTTWELLTERPLEGDEFAYDWVPVRDEVRDTAYRYLKFQADELPPPNDPAYPGMWTLADFRIDGERLEVPGALGTVSFTGSGTGVIKNRVLPGSALTLSFTPTEAIGDVAVTIGGQAVAATDQAGTYRATTTVGTWAQDAEFIPYTIDYTLADGTRAATVAGSTDFSTVWTSTGQGVINETLRSSAYSGTGQSQAQIDEAQRNLFANRADVKTNLAPSGGKAEIVWDLGEGNGTTFAGVDILLQQDGYGPGQIDDLVFSGSVDGEEWVALTEVPRRVLDWQRLGSSDPDTLFRYLKISSRLQIALASIQVFGQVDTPTRMDTVALTSAQPGLAGRILPGNAVTLDLTGPAGATDVVATIAGQQVPLTGGAGAWSATFPVDDEVPAGPLAFTIDFVTATGLRAPTITRTTDGSTYFVSSDDGTLDDLLRAATQLDHTMAPPQGLPANDTRILFDRQVGGNNKTQTKGSGGQAAIVWDLGEGSAVTFAGADVLLQQDTYGLNNVGVLRFEGSVDGQTWVPLTGTPAKDLAWQRLTSQDTASAFRYLRLANTLPIALSEIVVFGAPADVTPQPAAPTVDVTVRPRCVGPGAALAVAVRSTDDRPLAVTITTPLGEHAADALASGKQVAQTFAAGGPALAAGSVTVTATVVQDGQEVTSTQDVSYDARSC